jgi:hypothetical protein
VVWLAEAGAEAGELGATDPCAALELSSAQTGLAATMEALIDKNR